MELYGTVSQGSLVNSNPSTAFDIRKYIGGVRKHLAYWEIHDPKIIVTYLKLQTASEFVYMLDVTLSKVCILILYLRIFAERKKSTKGLISAIALCDEYSKSGWVLDSTYYTGIEPIALGTIELNIYFICLPDMKPPGRGIYRKFKPDKVNEFHYNSSPSSPAVGSKGYGSSVGKLHDSYTISISASRRQRDSSTGFEIPTAIQLDKTVYVNYS
ncbi:hypothetical protein F4814DRAFT_452473 [Daldinia grandis]|nr:hypothetical protein F4814DRAFT_452473 [Daldinia grandis]